MQSVLERATALHQQGRLADAAPLYRQALAAAPGNPRIAYMLAVLLYQQGDGAGALAAVNTALQAMPNLAEALMLRAASASTTRWRRWAARWHWRRKICRRWIPRQRCCANAAASRKAMTSICAAPC